MPFFYKLTASEIPADFKEAARYSGFFKTDSISPEIKQKIEQCIQKLQMALVPQAVYEEFDLKVEQNLIQFADISFESRDLSRNLEGCSKVILIAATVGAGVDQIIRRSQLSGSADAALMQATGAMFIESFMDKLNDKLRDESALHGKSICPRYSPGYGDVPLEFQKEFFRLLPCQKIGLTLMDSLIMAPEKSVTAFVGVKN